MSNEEILQQRWDKTEKTLKQYLAKFSSLGSDTMDRLIEIFDTMDITYQDLNKTISKEEKRRLDRRILEWKENGILTGYFEYLVYSKSKITYSDLLEIMIYSAYAEQEQKEQEMSKEIFVTVAKDIYNQALKEIPVKTKKFSLTWEYIWSLLWIPTYNKKWDEYLKLLTMLNEQEAYKQLLTYIQNKKSISSKDLKPLMQKQMNRIICINGDKYSGVISDTCRQLGNKIYTDPFKEEKGLQIRFIAEMDKRTTKMCESMNNMLFYVNDWNKFYRYSEIDKKAVLYTVKGLEQGINLPPINNHFHWCRSTITYSINIPDADILAEYNDYKNLKEELNIDIPDTLDEYAKLRYNKANYIDELKLKREIYKDYVRNIELGKEGEKTSFQKYYDKYIDSRKILGTVTGDGIRVGDVSTHAIYKMASRNISAKQIINILCKSKRIYDTEHGSLIYTIDDRYKVVLTNTEYHNIKTVMKTRK